jgi:hypothetical protein
MRCGDRRCQLWTNTEVDVRFALDEDELEAFAFHTNGQPAGVGLVAGSRALLESEHFGVERERLVLVAYDDRHVGQLHGASLRGSSSHH